MTVISLKLLAALAPAIVLSMIMIRKDPRPEPTSWLWRAVGLGVLVAPAVLLLGLLILPDIPADTYIGAFLNSFIDAAIPEEGMKFLALWFLANRCKHFDEMFDGIVYAVCIGMGFAGIENILYIFGSDSWMSVGIGRALLSVPSHWFFAIIMGAYFSLGWFDRINRRRYLAVALIFPIIVHGLYDTLCYAIGVNVEFSFAILIAFLLGFRYVRRYTRKLTDSMLKLDEYEQTE